MLYSTAHNPWNIEWFSKIITNLLGISAYWSYFQGRSDNNEKINFTPITFQEALRIEMVNFHQKDNLLSLYDSKLFTTGWASRTSEPLHVFQIGWEGKRLPSPS